MKRAQIISVGGSPGPLVSSIKQVGADYVVFFCSEMSKKYVDAKGKPCELWVKGELAEKQPSLVAQTGLKGGQYEIVVGDVDDLGVCYEVLCEAIDGLLDRGYSCVADYTGGSKTMTAAVVMAAIDRGQELYLTTGTRKDTLKVTHGEYTSAVSTQPIKLGRMLNQELARHLERYDFAAGVVLLEDSLLRPFFGREQKKQLMRFLALLRAWDAWDRFDHRLALQLLSDLQRQKSVRVQLDFLRAVASSREALDSNFEAPMKLRKGHGYEVLEDLLLNARRRAAQRRFDDAVGRLYRSLELFVQLRLKLQYEILTGSVRKEQVSDGFAEELEFRDGVAKIGLMKSFELLATFDGDPLGKLFSERRGALRDALSARNESLLAHGFQPVDEGVWNSFEAVVISFIEDGLRAIHGKDYAPPAQLPTSVPEDVKLGS